MNVSEYVERLFASFAYAPRPARADITPHRCCECDEVADRLSAYTARDVPEDDMHWLGDCLPLLSAKAFRFYLPRFIEFCLRVPNSNVEALINYNLVPSTDLDVGERNRFAGFSDEERRVVLEFVEYRASLPDQIHDGPYLEAASSFWRER